MSPEKHFKFPSFSTDTCWLETRRQTWTLKPPGEVHLGTNSSDVFVTITIVFTLHRKPEPRTRTRGQGDSPLGGRDGWVGRQTDRQTRGGIQRTDRQRRTGTGASYSKHDGDHTPLSSICHCCSSTFENQLLFWFYFSRLKHNNRSEENSGGPADTPGHGMFRHHYLRWISHTSSWASKGSHLVWASALKSDWTLLVHVH